MPSKPTREWLYTELDDLVARVSEKQHTKFLAGNFDDSSWLACAEDVLIAFLEDDLDDAIDGAAESRYDRACECDAEGPRGREAEYEMQHLMAEARGLK